MPYTARTWDHLLGGKLAGFTDDQLNTHFALYKGYVTKMNEIEEKLKAADASKANYSYSEYSELKRRESVAYNGTFLHEIYFDNLTSDENTAPNAGLEAALKDAFGSKENFIADIKGAALSTHGWVLTTFDEKQNKIRNNVIISEHHVGLMPHQRILLALDCWEHAYFVDYGKGPRKAAYLDAFLKVVDWNAASQRYGK
jgi:Fe-Mn family superoxide dismutase